MKLILGMVRHDVLMHRKRHESSLEALSEVLSNEIVICLGFRLVNRGVLVVRRILGMDRHDVLMHREA